MSDGLQCVKAYPVRVDGETVVKRCRGRIVPSVEGEGYICSDEGEMKYSAEVEESYAASDLWHKTSAVRNMLALLTRLNPKAENSSYPWIDLPLNHTDKAVVETSGGWWMVHVHRSDRPINSFPVDIPTSSGDTEAVAKKIAEILISLP